MTTVPRSRRVLVTGATGFIGRALIGRLVRDGYEMTALSRRQRPPQLAEEIEYIAADLGVAQDAARLRPFRWDAVVHLAGPAPRGDLSWDDGVDVIAAHVRTTAALRCVLPDDWHGRIIHASSFIVYGIPQVLPVSETHQRRPLHAYGLAKMLAEDILTSGTTDNQDLWLLRLPGMFSEARRSGAVASFAAAARAGRELIVDASHPLPWDLLHVDDAVEIIARALRSHAVNPGAINISHGETVDLVSIARRLVDRAGTHARVRLDGSTVHPPLRMDVTRMHELLGPLPRSLDERLDGMLASAAESPS